MKSIKFILVSIFRYLIGFPLSLLIRRSDKYITFWCKIKYHQELFMHNTKYLFLYLNNVENKYNYKLNWICNNKKMRKYLNKKGYKNVRSSYSLLGIFYALRSKIWLHDFSPAYLDSILNYNATFINLWHGSGGLKVIAETKLKNKLAEKFYKTFLLKDKYFITVGEVDRQCVSETIKLPVEQIKMLGFPRLDVLFGNFKDEDVFMEKELEYIKELKNKDKRLIIYVPTHRKSDKNIYAWLENKNLNKLLEENNAILLCKLHFIDANNIKLENCNSIYKINSQADLQPILRFCDGLITDYSSVYFDYLLLNRPIIHYVPDLMEYQSANPFYEPFENKAAGTISFTEEELFNAINDILVNVDKFKEKREALIKKTYSNIDNKNCERIVEFIRSLGE